MNTYRRCNRCHGTKQGGAQDSGRWHESLRLFLCNRCRREVFTLLSETKREQKPKRFVIPQ